jgi:GT2 family glycosyltransferase
METPPLVVSVIIYSGRQENIMECLDSLHRASYSNHRIIVLDYILSDGLSNVIRDTYSDVIVVELSENLGYAGTNNVGIKLAMEHNADWILILNDDTVLDKACLSLLISNGERNSNIGIVGPLVYHFDEPDIIQSAGGILDQYWNNIHIGGNEMDRGQFTKIQQVDWVSGCALLVRRAAVEQVGMLDPGYFLYWEETEWCLRAGRAGWRILNIPQARLWHKGVQRDYQPKPYVTYYMTRNHLFTLSKYKAPLRAWVFTLVQIVRSLVSWTIKPRWRHKREHRNAMWHGLVDFIKHRQGPMPFYLLT